MTRIETSVGAGVGGGIGVSGGGGTGVSGGGGTGVRFGREGGFVGTGVFVGIGKYPVEVGEAVGVRVGGIEVEEAVGVRDGGIKEAEEVGEDIVGASVAFTCVGKMVMVDERVVFVINIKVAVLVEEPPPKNPDKPFKEPSPTSNPTKKSTLRTSPNLFKKILLFASPD